MNALNKRRLVIGLVVLVLLAALPVAVFAQSRAVIGEGTLTAQGDGKVVIRGNGSVDFTVQGKLVALDFGLSNATFDITCTGSEKELVVNGNTRKYVCKGEASGNVTGQNIKVKQAGFDIDLTATGVGFARLKGQGTYDASGTTGEWTEFGSKIDFGTPE